MAKAKTARCRLLAIPIAREAVTRDRESTPKTLSENSPKEGFPHVHEMAYYANVNVNARRDARSKRADLFFLPLSTPPLARGAAAVARPRHGARFVDAQCAAERALRGARHR